MTLRIRSMMMTTKRKTTPTPEFGVAGLVSRIRAAAFIAAAFLLLAPAAFAQRPVVVELFTDPGCGQQCDYAENSALRLVEDFGDEQVHLLVYEPFEPGAPLEARERMRFYLSRVPREADLPFIVFGGVDLVQGASNLIYPTYRNNFTNRQSQASRGTIDAWMDIADGQLVASATVAAQLEPAPDQFDFHVIVSEPRQSDGQPLVRRFESLEPDERQEIERDWGEGLNENVADVLMILQNRVTREIWVSLRAEARSPVAADVNQDGRLDSEDALFFAFLWSRNDERADLNLDGVINALDVLTLLGPRP